jgi:hypothetical protein
MTDEMQLISYTISTIRDPLKEHNQLLTGASSYSLHCTIFIFSSLPFRSAKKEPTTNVSVNTHDGGVTARHLQFPVLMTELFSSTWLQKEMPIS